MICEIDGWVLGGVQFGVLVLVGFDLGTVGSKGHAVWGAGAGAGFGRCLGWGGLMTGAGAFLRD